MLDPLTALAFSMFSGKGVYALLVGSGISRAAEIPTGWEVTLDLIRKIAAASHADCSEDPAEWYRQKFGKEPDYSNLLALVAQNPAERTNVLASYFEATDDEKARGAKTPTAAHRAIARLVSKGYIRVILTTNFDRLLEQALATEGVATTVISTVDMVLGALPLVHAACTVIKVHGDYRDTRFRNTAEELASYSPEMNALLDRIIDEYGMVVVGWSAAWDQALRSAFMRAANRRFSMTWAAHGGMTAEAQELVTFRGALIEDIDSADRFFSSLLAKVESLEKFNAPHPLSVQLAVATLKRYLAESRYRIDLHDLMMTEVERVIKVLRSSKTASKAALSTHAEYFEMMQVFEAESEVLIALAGNYGYFAESDHANLLGKAIIRLLELAKGHTSHTQITELRSYPACLMFYASGVAACATNRYTVLVPLFRTTYGPSDENVYETKPIPAFLFASKSLNGGWVNAATGEKKLVPASERLFSAIRELLRVLIPNDDAFAEAFDRFEYLLALRVFEERSKGPHPWPWGPIGRFLYRRRDFGKHISIVLEEEAKENSGAAAFLSSGLFPNALEFQQLNVGFKEIWTKVPNY